MQDREGGQRRRKRTIFDEIVTELTVHTEIEEEYLYPGMKSAPRETVAEYEHEHKAVETLIEDLKKRDPFEP